MFDQFRGRFPLLNHKWDQYIRLYNRIEVPARTILLREGEISNKAYMIEEGCLRAWFYNKDKDITFQFFFENEGISSAESFRKRIPSFITIETLEPSVLHWISKENLDKILEETMEIPEMRKWMMDALFERQANYMHHFVSLIRDTPTERYLSLIKDKPHILQRVPQQYIASYLGITPVSLSRIRKKVSGH
jgi:CRP-like cAMP-binding protein